MRWPTPLILMGWLAIFIVDLTAEEIAYQAPPQTANDYLPSPTLLRQSSAATFHLVLGRLQLDPVRYRKGSFSMTHPESVAQPGSPHSQAIGAQAVKPHANVPDAVNESLTINSVRGRPSMQYVMTRRGARVSIDVDTEGTWRVKTERKTDQGERKLSIEQVTGKPLRMRCTIQSAADNRSEPYEVHGSTLLHLREADRAAFIEDVEPLLDELLHPYRMQTLAEEAHAHSLREPAGSMAECLVSDATIQVWIHELSSPNRVRRTDAERRLTAIGIALLPRLAKLDVTRLDTEQRARLNEIQRRLTPKGEDDAGRLSVLIRDDGQYWRLAASRLDDRELQVVNHRLQRLGERSPLLPTDSARIATRPATRER